MSEQQSILTSHALKPLRASRCTLADMSSTKLLKKVCNCCKCSRSLPVIGRLLLLPAAAPGAAVLLLLVDLAGFVPDSMLRSEPVSK